MRIMPGYAYCIIQSGRIIRQDCFGYADIENRIPITPSTAFRLASLTKLFTAMAIMILKDQQQLCFEDSMLRFFPLFPRWGKPITIRHLLTHTSGMPDHEKPLYRRIKLGEEPTMSDALEVLKKEKPLFRAGTKYKYSDAGFVILALIIERITGLKYREFLKESVFFPLKMTETVVVDETKPCISNRAYGYKKNGNFFENFDYDPLNWIVGDEGIYSTINDLSKWIESWNNDLLVSEAILKEALTSFRISENKYSRCAFSWFISKSKNQPIRFHDGSWVGFRNIVFVDVKREKTVIFLSNTTGLDSERQRISVVKKLLDLVY